MNRKAPVLFLCLAAAVLVLLAYLPSGKEGAPVSYVPMEPVTILVATDPHFLAPGLTDGEEAFLNVVTHADGKYMQRIGEITDALFDRAAAERPAALILSGDLTFNGERESHEAFAAKCAALEAKGVPVLVLPGNHDLNRPDAARFEGDQITPAENITAADFRRIYAAFGYDEALSEDAHSLSYVCHLCPGLRLLFVDCNAGAGNDTIPDETFAWIEAELQSAAEAGERVIAVSHQTVLQHNARFVDGFAITNQERLLRLYREYHVALNLSGHMHIQHIRQESGLTELVTGALSVQPCSYGVLTLTERGGDYVSRSAVSAELQSEATAFFRDNAFHQGMAAGDADMAKYLADLNTAYFSGRMDLAERNDDLLRRWRETDAFTVSYIESLLADLGRDCTKGSFTF